MPKHQTNIHSFFGGAGGVTQKKKKNPKKNAPVANAAASSKNKRKKEQEADETGKENSVAEKDTNKKLITPSDNKSNNNTNDNNGGSSKSKKEARKRRRLAIQEDSDEDDQTMMEGDSANPDNDDTERNDETMKLEDNTNDNNNTDDDNKPVACKDHKEHEKEASASELVSNSEGKDDRGDSESGAKGQDEAKDGKVPTKEADATTQMAKKTEGNSEVDSSCQVSKPKLSSALKDKKIEEKDSQTKSTKSELAYSELCQAMDKIESISARLEIQKIVTELFQKQIDKDTTDNMYDLMYLLCNAVAPACDNIELGVGDSILIKAIAEAYGKSTKNVKDNYDEEGDLGVVAMASKKKQKTLGNFFKATKRQTKALTCHEVLSTLKEISQISGKDSQRLKSDKIKKLLVKVTQGQESQAKFIIRALQGRLRIGLAESSVLVSLSHALSLTVPKKAKEAMKGLKGLSTDGYPAEAKDYLEKKSAKDKKGMLAAAEAIVKRAYSEAPSYDKLLDAVLTVPLQLVHNECTLTPGIPIAPMLAKPTKSVQEVLKRLDGKRFTLEYKYDGERAQVHMLSDGTAKVFSRNLLNTTEKYPEAPAYVKEAAGDSVQSCVLDTEVVAYDGIKEKLVPFQVLSTRKKSEESAESAKVQVIVQAFDLMYLNGESLLDKPLQQRRDLLHKFFAPVHGKFSFASSLDYENNDDTAAIEEFLDQAIKGQCEGLMVKTLEENGYEPSKRTFNWLKLKKDYLDGVSDTFDLVPIGAFYGKGKRTGVYGAYLLACYDPESEEFQSVCKIGTGFSDDDLKSLAEGLNKHIIPQKTSQYKCELDCDVWFDAVQVWEAKAADLSKSSLHRGAIGKTGEEGRGIGLRFPRFERVREDKKPEQATTSDQVLEMYYNQDTVAGGDDDAGDDDGI